MDGGTAESVRGEIDNHLDCCSRYRAVIMAAGSRCSPSERDATNFEAHIPAPATFRPGTTVDKRYRTERLIGRGGMGEVYVAHDIQLGTRIALKTVNARIASHPRIAATIKREVLLARQVTHPSVCRVFDFGEHEGVGFLTMELLDGETLGARLRRTGPMSPTTALPIAQQLVGALEAAHAAGVIHRDFKSDNIILLDREPGDIRAVVTDFGLARAHSSPLAAASESQESSPGRLIGTLSYMAPEQINGRAVTRATDIYALGVVLFEMVTGRLPFPGSSTLHGAVRRLSERPISPSAIVPGLLPSWDATIRRCLEREPSKRFQTARAVWEALGQRAHGRRTWRRVKSTFVTSVLATLAFGVARPLSLRSSRAAPPTSAPVRLRASVAPGQPATKSAVQRAVGTPPERLETRSTRRRARLFHHVAAEGGEREIDEARPTGGAAPPSPGTSGRSDELLDPRDDEVMDPYDRPEIR